MGKTVKECYENFGGDYEDVCRRLRSEMMVQRFLKMFLDDPSYPDFIRALEESNLSDAFRQIHTLKGVCQNIGMTLLGRQASVITEKLRRFQAETEQVPRPLLSDCWKEENEEIIKSLKPDVDTLGMIYELTRKEIEELPE